VVAEVAEMLEQNQVELVVVDAAGNPGVAGTINTGSGGGGTTTSGAASTRQGGAGGSGIVIIRYKFQ
jgi:hypothetical protein